MSAASAIDIGDDVVISAYFTDAITASPVFPASLICRVQNGHGSEVATYVFGQGTLTLSSPTYQVVQPITATFGHGHWRYRFEGRVPNVAEEFTFFVRPSNFS
jgi:hypothetical protein